jgi:hypothetical protein
MVQRIVLPFFARFVKHSTTLVAMKESNPDVGSSAKMMRGSFRSYTVINSANSLSLMMPVTYLRRQSKTFLLPTRNTFYCTWYPDDSVSRAGKTQL